MDRRTGSPGAGADDVQYRVYLCARTGVRFTASRWHRGRHPRRCLRDSWRCAALPAIVRLALAATTHGGDPIDARFAWRFARPISGPYHPNGGILMAAATVQLQVFTGSGGTAGVSGESGF